MWGGGEGAIVSGNDLQRFGRDWQLINYDLESRYLDRRVLFFLSSMPKGTACSSD